MHGEVMVAISNANYAQPGGMLDTWAESVLRAGVKNAMVVALDEATKAHAESKGLPAFQMTLEVSHRNFSVLERCLHQRAFCASGG